MKKSKRISRSSSAKVHSPSPLSAKPTFPKASIGNTLPGPPKVPYWLICTERPIETEIILDRGIISDFFPTPLSVIIFLIHIIWFFVSSQSFTKNHWTFHFLIVGLSAAKIAINGLSAPFSFGSLIYKKYPRKNPSSDFLIVLIASIGYLWTPHAESSMQKAIILVGIIGKGFIFASYLFGWARGKLSSFALFIAIQDGLYAYTFWVYASLYNPSAISIFNFSQYIN